MRDGAHARLFSFHDLVWRRPFHTREKSSDGALTFAAHAISGRFSVPHSFSRFRRGGPAFAIGARESRPLLHQYPRRFATCAAHFATTAEGHEADRHDYRRQAFGAHSRRWPNL